MAREATRPVRKPQKPTKALKPKVPADQLALKTECGHCHTLFANPTLAGYHVEGCEAR